jgi:DNA-damage-inducible protein J
MKNSVIRARVDEGLKADASAVLEACGLGLSDAIRMFLSQVVEKGGLPFAVRASEKQMWQVKHAAQRRDRALVKQHRLSGNEMLLIPPDKAIAAEVEWPVIG